MFTRNKLLTTAMAAVIGLSASLASAETFGQALSSAYENSGLLEYNRAVLRAADEDVAQAVASLRPAVSWSSSHSRAYDFEGNLLQTSTELARISASFDIWDAGIGAMGVEQQKATVLATRESLKSVELDVLSAAVTAYLNVQTAGEFVNLRESNVRVLTQELRAAQDRFDVGEVTRTDVSIAEAALASARSLLAVAQGSLANAREAYVVTIGHLPSNLQGVPVAPLPMNLTDAQAYAVRNHPTVVALQHQIAAAEIGLTRAQSATMPTVSATATAGIDEDFNGAAQFGINAGGPIYLGGQLDSAVRQVRDRIDGLRAQLHRASLLIEQGVANAYSNYQVAVSASEAYSRQVSAAQLAFDGVREEANAGSRTTIDVLNAEQDLLDARANRVSAQADVVLASYGVLYAMGLLNASHLNLDVTQYDVEAHYNLVADAPLARSEQGAALERVLEALR